MRSVKILSLFVLVALPLAISSQSAFACKDGECKDKKSCPHTKNGKKGKKCKCEECDKHDHSKAETKPADAAPAPAEPAAH